MMVLLEDVDVADEADVEEEIEEGGAESIDDVRGPISFLVETVRVGVDTCFPKVGAPIDARFEITGSSVTDVAFRVVVSSIGTDVRTSMLI